MAPPPLPQNKKIKLSGRARSGPPVLLVHVVIMRKKIASVKGSTLARFAARARRAARLHGRVDVLITSSRKMRELNSRFCGKDKPTDVLSFPAQTADKQTSVGDIAVSAEIAAANAKRLGHSVADELKILILHGVLHLAGYDHATDNGRMARKERKLRRELRLPDALIERSARPSAPSGGSVGLGVGLRTGRRVGPRSKRRAP